MTTPVILPTQQGGAGRERPEVGPAGAPPSPGAATALSVPPLADAALALAAAVVRAAADTAQALADATRPLTRVVAATPWLGPRWRPAGWLGSLAATGRSRRLEATDAALALVPTVAAVVLDRLDLTRIVRERVDLDSVVSGVDVESVVARVDIDAVAARLDVDAVAGRLDLDAVIARLDLAELAREVIDAIDLPEIVRESTGAMASETVHGVRMRGIEADEQVSRIVDRLLLRRRARATVAPAIGPEGP